MVKDMTTGSPTRLILFFTLPLLVGNIFQQLYNMADTIIVGRTLGYKALAAVGGSSGSIMFLVFGFFFGLTCGLAVITAQRFGAHDEDGVRRSVAASLVMCAVITAAATLLCVLGARPVLELMRTPEDIVDETYNYLIVMFWGGWTIVFYGMLSSIIRALGDSRTPLYFLIISSIVNVVLDFYFILSLKSGVAGAAWATVIAQGLSGVLCLVYMLRKFPILRLRRHDWIFNASFYWDHLRVALPMAFQFSVTAIGVLVLQTALNGFGSVAVAGYTAAARIDQLAIQPLFSFSIAMATFAAQNYGAGNIPRIRDGVFKCSAMALGFSVFGGVPLILFASPVTAWFIGGHDEQVIHCSQIYLNTNASCYVILAMLLIYRNVQQGMGHSFIPFMAGVVELVLRVVGAFGFAVWFGYTGVCLSNPLAWIGATAILAWDYCRTMKKLRREFADGVIRPVQR